MDFDEMNNFLSNHKMGHQDIRYRIRKRGLESKERRLLGTASCAYGFNVFLLCNTALAPLLDQISPRSALTALAAGSLVLALVFAYVIYRIWRNPPPSAVLMAMPGLLFFLLGLPSLSLLCIPNGVALSAFYFLHKTWKELAAMSVQAAETAAAEAGAVN